MNRKDTLEAIRAAGMAGTYDAGTREYRVTYPAQEMPDKERREAVASYTDDPADAIGTAKAMRERQNIEDELAHLLPEPNARSFDDLTPDEMADFELDVFLQREEDREAEAAAFPMFHSETTHDIAAAVVDLRKGDDLRAALHGVVCGPDPEGVTPERLAFVEFAAQRFEAARYDKPQDRVDAYRQAREVAHGAVQSFSAVDLEQAESRHAMTGEDMRDAFRQDAAKATEKAASVTPRPTRPRGFGMDR